MPDTVAGLFRTRVEAETALRNLKEAGFGPDQVSLATPRIGRRGRYGLKVLIGIAAGTVVGALLGAVVTGMVPGVHPWSQATSSRPSSWRRSPAPRLADSPAG